MRTRALKALLAGVIALSIGCGGGAPREESDDRDEEEEAEEGELTKEQMEKGIGPITDLDVGPIDAAMAERGAGIFQIKCSACHQLDQRYVGPPLRAVTERRAPEYIMNMILNPAEMLEHHPVARQLLAEYFTPMPAQNLTIDEARAVLEYLRQMAQVGPATTTGEAGT